MSLNKTDLPERIFGTDGIRGIANREPLTAETVLKIGRAAAYVFRSLHGHSINYGRHKIIIGKDTRLSGYMLENALACGILSMGVDVLFIGPLPTPGVAYVTRSLRANAGIVITASHNPYHDNGIKFFRADGFKLDDEIEKQIEELVFSGRIDNIRPVASEIGKAIRIDDALGRYIEFAKASFPKGMTLEGMRIVVDTANGAAYKSTPCVLRELGAEVIVYGNQPNGMNINDNCGTLYPEVLSRLVLEHKATVGIAHDGDGDRVIMCDEMGNIVDGDDMLVVAAIDMLERSQLTNKVVVATVMSNLGIDKAIEKAGGRVVRTHVGDKYVIERMLEEGAILGGEPSGHIVFLEHTTTGDGLISALQILRIMKSQNKLLSQLIHCWDRYPQRMINVGVKEKVPFEEIPPLYEAIRKAEIDMNEQGGRVLVRYSGTEPVARVMVEGPDRNYVYQLAEALALEIRKHLGN